MGDGEWEMSWEAASLKRQQHEYGNNTQNEK